MFLLFVPGAIAQALESSEISVERGSANIVRLMLKADPAKPVAALQWELAYQPGSFRINPTVTLPGAAAERAGKSLTCAPKTSDSKAIRLACVLAGGTKAIDGGVIAIFRVDADPQGRQGKTSIEVERILGVSPAMDSIPFPGVTIGVTVR